MPKSSSTGSPSARTSTLPGLRSQCTTRCACAACTARQMRRNSCSRSRRPGLRVRHQASSGCPSTSSITRYGKPAAVVPPSYRWAMLGWRSPARMRRSAARRSALRASGSPCRSFTATLRSYRPSARSARYTTPMPPAPRRSPSRHGPSMSPGFSSGAAMRASRPSSGARARSSATVCERSSSSVSRISAGSRVRRASSSSQVSGGRSHTASNRSRSCRQRSSPIPPPVRTVPLRPAGG